jgi:hypothetical protein
VSNFGFLKYRSYFKVPLCVLKYFITNKVIIYCKRTAPSVTAVQLNASQTLLECKVSRICNTETVRI